MLAGRVSLPCWPVKLAGLPGLVHPGQAWVSWVPGLLSTAGCLHFGPRNGIQVLCSCACRVLGMRVRAVLILKVFELPSVLQGPVSSLPFDSVMTIRRFMRESVVSLGTFSRSCGSFSLMVPVRITPSFAWHVLDLAERQPWWCRMGVDGGEHGIWECAQCPCHLKRHRGEDPEGEMILCSGERHDSWLPIFLLLPDDRCGSLSTCWCHYYGMSLRVEDKEGVPQQAG